MNNYKIIKFTHEDIDLDVRVSPEDNTVWLSQDEIAILFRRNQSAISRHLKNIYAEKVFKKEGTYAKNAYIPTTRERSYEIEFYNLDIIMEIGRRIKSPLAGIFFNWCKSILSDLITEIMKESNIITFRDNGLSLDVRISPEENTVYLNQNQIAVLFDTTKQNISKHIRNIIEEGELTLGATVNFLFTVQTEQGREVKREIEHYNLKMIMAIGYRVNSETAIRFRNWASDVLSKYLINGYALDNNRLVLAEGFIKLRNDVDKLQNDFIELKTKIFTEPIKQKLFIDGKYFDAYEFICSLIMVANNEILIIDPYFDINDLSYLKHAKENVQIKIVLSSRSELYQKDIEEFEKQYSKLQIIVNDTIHDRFIITDKNIGYSIGASLNFAGRRTFLTYKIPSQEIIDYLLKYGEKEEDN